MPTQTTRIVTHSPGPWHVSTDGNYYAVLDADHHVIANVLGSPRKANAQLISQTPRLLKTATDLWHANAAEGPDRDELLIASAWAELIDAIEAADESGS